MKTFSNCLLILIALFCCTQAITGCNGLMHETVKGDGNRSSESRSVNSAAKIKLYGNYDVQLVQGTAPGVKLEADRNLLSYITVEETGGWLEIKTRNDVSLRSANPIKITVTTPMLEALDVAGSSNVQAASKFTGAASFSIDLAGSGIVTIPVNTPKINASIAGSGNVLLSGETKNLDLDIAGSGAFKGEGLMSEDVHVSVAGSGEATVYAASHLNAEIAGSGYVYYKGPATVTTDISGSGGVKPIN